MQAYDKFRSLERRGKMPDPMTYAIKMMDKLAITETDIHNRLVIGYAYQVLLSGPGEIRSSAYMKLYHILVGAGCLWAEKYMAELRQ